VFEMMSTSMRVQKPLFNIVTFQELNMGPSTLINDSKQRRRSKCYTWTYL
jgi:hypothetical protein